MRTVRQYHILCCCLAIIVGVITGFCITTWTRQTLLPCLLRVRTMSALGSNIVPPSIKSFQHWTYGQDNLIQPIHMSPAYKNQQRLRHRREFDDPNIRVIFGIMTAEKFMEDRATAILNSWRLQLPSGSKALFFVGENSSAISNFSLPAVLLKGVDDTYPPQRKSFSVLKYFYDHMLDKYDFFIRLDDDAFVNVDNLYAFLSSVDSNKPLFIGQAGFGRKHEIGKMGLKPDENYCMGGTGMIFSKRLIETAVPYFPSCVTKLFTDHEDVELSRCISRSVGVMCTRAFEASRFFYNSYVTPAEKAYAGDVNFYYARKAFTLHPVKLGVYQYRLAWTGALNKARRLRHELARLSKAATSGSTALDEAQQQQRQHPLNTNGATVADRNTVKAWDFFSRAVSSVNNENPRFFMDSRLQLAVREMNVQLLELLNRNSSERGRVIEYRDVYYAFRRVHPLLGVDYVLDILLQYRRVVGQKPLSMAVRRHSYFRQSFGKLEFKPLAYDDTAMATSDIFVNFILPLSGRIETFKRFLVDFEAAFLVHREKVTLTVVIFQSDNDDSTAYDAGMAIQALQARYPHDPGSPPLRILLLPSGQNFSRSVGLQEGARALSPNDLLFFIDVDIAVERSLLQRVRTLVQKGKQVFMPIVFSEFDPSFSCQPPQCPAISDGAGYWRMFGFGIAAMYGSELTTSGGFDTSIQGWGKEDVDLLEKLLRGGISVVRAPDPSLIHRFHPVRCNYLPGDGELSATDAQQRAMCEGTRLSGFGDRKLLARLLLQLGIVNKEGSAPTSNVTSTWTTRSVPIKKQR